MTQGGQVQRPAAVEVQERLLPGALGVSPNTLVFPQEWGTKGVDRIHGHQVQRFKFRKEKVEVKLPEYVSKAEIKRVCKELGLKDWSVRKDTKVTKEEAATILKVANTGGMRVPVEEFRMGLEVELEHGTMYPDTNVTNNHPVLTGKIVLAHLKETMDYYERLDVTEIEGDLLKAVKAQDLKKIGQKYNKLIAAQGVLYGVVAKQLK